MSNNLHTSKELNPLNEALAVHCKPFAELVAAELYDILRLRQQVFILEQSCLYLDTDGYDEAAHHLMIYNKQKDLVAYSRLFGLNMPYAGYLSIGRVVTNPRYRGLSYGRILMRHSIEQLRSIHGPHPIKIGAQAYLIGFYSSLGFRSTGQRYLEDGIPHLKMILDQ